MEVETGTPSIPLMEQQPVPTAGGIVPPGAPDGGGAAVEENRNDGTVNDVEAVVAQPTVMYNNDSNNPEHGQVEHGQVDQFQQQDEEEAEEERQVPPISHHFRRMKYWMWAFRYPMGFVLVNAIVIVSLLVIMSSMIDSSYDRYFQSSFDEAIFEDDIIFSLDDDDFDVTDDDYPTARGSAYNDTSEHSSKAERMMRSFIIITSLYGLLFLVDTILCYKGAKFVEKQLQSLEMGENETNDLQMQVGVTTSRADAQVPFIPLADRDDDDDENDAQRREMNNVNRRQEVNFAELSREVDQFFGLPTTASNATFLVSLLFALWALSLCGAEVAVATVIYAKLETNGTLACIAPYRGFRGNAGEALEDDPAFATFPEELQKWIRDQEINRDWFMSDDSKQYYVELDSGSIFFVAGSEWGNSRIIEHTTAGTVIVHQEVGQPSQLTAISSPLNKTLNTGFCGQSGEDKVFCYNPTSGFRMENGRHHSWNYWSYDTKMYYYENKLWVFAHVYEDDRSRLELDTVDLGTMERKKVIESRAEEVDVFSTGNCRGIEKFSKANVAVICALSAVFLYYFQDVPSSFLPGSLSLFLGLFLLSAYAGEIFGLVVAYLILGLLGRKKLPQRLSFVWRYTNREMLCWAFYTLLLCVMIGSSSLRLRWDDATWDFVVSGATSFFGGLYLGHPVFEILGIVFGLIAILSAVTLVFIPFDIVLIPLWVVLSLGCWSTGLMIRKYRLHVTVYFRRCRRCLCSCCCFCCRRGRGAYQAAETQDIGATAQQNSIIVVVPPTPQ